MVFSSTCGATSSGPIVYLPGCSGTMRGSHVEVAAELLPHDVHVAAEHQVGAGRGLPGSLSSLAPVPLQRQRAEHDRLRRALRAGPGRLAGRVEEVGEHPDAALLDLGRARVLGVVDEVAVQVGGDDPLRLRLHPRRDEGGEVARRIAFQGQVLGDQAHGVHRGHPRLRELTCRHLLGDEAVAEQRRIGARVARDCHSVLLRSIPGGTIAAVASAQWQPSLSRLGTSERPPRGSTPHPAACRRWRLGCRSAHPCWAARSSRSPRP